MAVAVRERTPGVAWVDRGVGLNHLDRHRIRLVGATEWIDAVRSTDDACSDGLVKTERRADGDGQLPDLDRLTRSKSGLDEIEIAGIDLHDRDVTGRITADHDTAHLHAVVQQHADGVSGVGDMVVGDDVAVGCIPDDPAALTKAGTDPHHRRGDSASHRRGGLNRSLLKVDNWGRQRGGNGVGVGRSVGGRRDRLLLGDWSLLGLLLADQVAAADKERTECHAAEDTNGNAPSASARPGDRYVRS